MVMKMGTTLSSWGYDVATGHTLQLVKLLRPAILHYTSSGYFRDFAGTCRSNPGGHAKSGSLPRPRIELSWRGEPSYQNRTM